MIESFKSGRSRHPHRDLGQLDPEQLPGDRDATGTAANLGNKYGILIDTAGSNNSVGGLTTVGNLISGNTLAGVAISGAAALQNVIQGNLIGTTPAGTTGLANAAGIIIDTNASNNSIEAARPIGAMSSPSIRAPRSPSTRVRAI